ncbi:cytochrome P450 ClCP1 [Colletotrichum orchidophilum]|uniref:Cytochrome P450 ClCP1 n=1 Tax=Colletotrichum orchidophilum TaxID=1209926 RepID=A0A1G4B9L4_9PEZI|nr:cytochrome P450 ClCP1 [Colletotrichum orchidophilum]OHE98081.1 cytochrome P450 ClCP1 [Colletotrichum orchidophilum]
MQQQALEHKRLTREKIGKRLALKDPRPNFFQGLITGTGDWRLGREQLENNGEFITMAGSETTASLLGGAVYQLTTNPRVMAKLVDEIIATFKNEGEITLVSAGGLPYLCAVTEESLRTFPPGTNTQPRSTPSEGNVILGDHIPGNIVVGIPHHAMYYTEANFKRAHEFIPERWMNDPEFASD